MHNIEKKWVPLWEQLNRELDKYGLRWRDFWLIRLVWNDCNIPRNYHDIPGYERIRNPESYTYYGADLWAVEDAMLHCYPREYDHEPDVAGRKIELDYQDFIKTKIDDGDLMLDKDHIRGHHYLDLNPKWDRIYREIIDTVFGPIGWFRCCRYCCYDGSLVYIVGANKDAVLDVFINMCYMPSCAEQYSIMDNDIESYKWVKRTLPFRCGTKVFEKPSAMKLEFSRPVPLNLSEEERFDLFSQSALYQEILASYERTPSFLGRCEI